VQRIKTQRKDIVHRGLSLSWCLYLLSVAGTSRSFITKSVEYGFRVCKGRTRLQVNCWNKKNSERLLHSYSFNLECSSYAGEVNRLLPLGVKNERLLKRTRIETLPIGWKLFVTRQQRHCCFGKAAFVPCVAVCCDKGISNTRQNVGRSNARMSLFNQSGDSLWIAFLQLQEQVCLLMYKTTVPCQFKISTV